MASVARAHKLLQAMLLALVVALAGWLATPPTAAAQDIGQDALNYLETFAFKDSLHTWDDAKLFGAEMVSERTREGFLPQGIMVPGGHLLLPSVGLATTYDDNIYLAPHGLQEGDLRYDVTPRIAFVSDLPRHMINVDLQGRFAGFASHPDLNYEDGSARLDWRLDIDAADVIGGTASSNYGHEDRFYVASPLNAAGPIPIWINRAAINYAHDAGRMALATGLDWERTSFYDIHAYDGSLIDEQKGDSTLIDGWALLRYRMSPGYSAFLAGKAGHTTYVNDRSRDGDNTSYRGETGLTWEASPLLKVTVAGGYDYFDYDNPAVVDVGAVAFRGEITWLPTTQLTLRLEGRHNLSQTVLDPLLGFQGDVVSLHADYDVWHNVVLHGDASFEQDAFLGSPRVDQLWSAGASLDYLMNPNVLFTFAYEHRTRESNDDSYDFDDNRFMAKVTLSE